MTTPHVSEWFTPLYDTRAGGPPKAFLCALCGKVTRTEEGIFLHLTRVHKIERQGCLTSSETNLNSTKTECLSESPSPNPSSNQSGE